VRLLLDTHIWIWSQLAPDKLSVKVTRALSSATNELWLSPVSTWELIVLVEKGRIVLETDCDQWLASVAERAPAREAPLTSEIVRATRAVHLPHRDPVDRFLAATARVLDLTLVTGDRQLLAGRGYETMANK
jgi:PIN domain nuclease of toxin-antitoxin system